jgi:citrate lyase subunit beta/citryl-CoA lyase
VTVPPLTWLYVPADRPDRVEKAIASRAHAVIVDLEDAVAPGAKAAARAALPDVLGLPIDKLVHVRVNPPSTPYGRADLELVGELPGVAGLHLPKVEGPDDVDAVLELLPRRGSRRYRLHCLLESARGVEAAYAIASCGPEVTGISLGEADLSGETGASGTGLDWARSRTINAACAAGLPRPPQSVYPHVRDGEGLARSCAHGRALGHLGRAAIHPAQLPVIEQAYLPSAEDVAAAEELLERFTTSSDQQIGSFALATGQFVDAAVIRSARQTVELANRYGTRDPEQKEGT